MHDRTTGARAPARITWALALVLGACAGPDGALLDDVTWGTMGHGGRQSQRSADRMLWSLAVRAPHVLLEVDGRRVVLKDVVPRGDLRYALRDEVSPHIWLELPDGEQLDWDGIELASEDGSWRLDREGRYELDLSAEEPLAYLGL